MQNSFIQPAIALAEQIRERLPSDSIQSAAVRFDLEYYRDDLFRQSGVTRPDGMERWVPKRKAEYLAGRVAANCSLDQVVTIKTGTHREPLWPPGVTGTISHNRNIAIALTTRLPNGLLGADIESVIAEEKLMQIRKMFMDDTEFTLIQSADATLRQQLSTALFSAKESFFKAVFPVVRQYFDFDAIRLVQFSSDDLTFRLDADFPELQRWLHGGSTFKLPWFRIDEDSPAVLTLITLQA